MQDQRNEVDEAAAWDYIRQGYLPAPRTVLKGQVKPVPSPLPSISVETNQLPVIVKQTLESALGSMAGQRRAIMFSGGFDSILMTSLAKRLGAKVTAVTIQFDHFNPITVAAASQCAHQLGIPHHLIEVQVNEFLLAFESLAQITPEPLMDLDLAVVYAALKKYDAAMAGHVFISGMGADQWFGDLALEQNLASLAARLDWAMLDQSVHCQVAQLFGHTFSSPFLSFPMLALSSQIPDAMKKDKQLLRALSVAQGIPSRGAASEEQMPLLMRQTFIKVYGRRAWPGPVRVPDLGHRQMDQTLRQIILGLWLEKRKNAHQP